MATALALLLCLGAGTVGGVFYAFSTFVMRALAGLPVAQGVAAMQRINVVVLNPAFLGVFIGSALLSLACIAFAWWAWGAPHAPWLLAAGLSYALGSFGVTMVFNVPRNERLARMEASSADAQAYWPVYVREWTRWNHVRCAGSLAGAACAAAALVVAP
jgi:uncharacterized membrane protein